MGYPVGWKSEVVVRYHSETHIPTSFGIQISVLGLGMRNTREYPGVSCDGWANGVVVVCVIPPPNQYYGTLLDIVKGEVAAEGVVGNEGLYNRHGGGPPREFD